MQVFLSENVKNYELGGVFFKHNLKTHLPLKGGRGGGVKIFNIFLLALELVGKCFKNNYLLTLKNPRKFYLFFFRIETLLHLGVPNNQILLHFSVPDNQTLLRFGVPDNQILLHFGVSYNCSMNISS